MSYQLDYINRCAKEPAAFLEMGDAAYARNVSRAAERILEHLSISPIVLLAGPSGSGKTTTALKIEEELEKRGVQAHTISLDNYFLDVTPEHTPRTEDGEYDFESPLCLDMGMLDAHFTALSQGEEVVVPKFNFAERRRDRDRGVPLRLGKDEVAVFEGIHALGDGLTQPHPEAMKLYISTRSDIEDGEETVFWGSWMRLARRSLRDSKFRNTPPEETLAIWQNVRRGEGLYITPFRSRADIILDSTLPYEVCVMRTVLAPLLEEISQEKRGLFAKLLAEYERFDPIQPQLVAEDSLLREFLGGGSYHY